MGESRNHYNTIRKPSTFEIPKIKGSRFIALVYPVKSREDAKVKLDQVRRNYSDASHHCFAFRIQADPVIHQSSDDGEPTATAGIPILKQMESRDLQNALVVVVRYFGGTKLGKGGLIRAYGSAARKLISEIDLVSKEVKSRLQIVFPYSSTSIVRRVLSKSNADILNEVYGENTILDLALPRAKEGEFVHELDNALSGKLVWNKLGEAFE